MTGDLATAIGNASMRGASLAARFALSIYIVRALGYEQLGIFGLLSGLAGAAPALLGFGVSFRTNRLLLLANRGEGLLILRDRLALSATIALAVAAVASAAIALALVPRPAYFAPGLAIVMLELVAFDLHIGLINLSRPIAANFLLFLRSASWIVPVMALGILVPSYRTLGILLAGWLCALLAHFVALLALFRDTPFRRLATTPVRFGAMLAPIRRGGLIYANEVALMGQTYVDRFIVAHLIGLRAAGIYTLCFSITQGLYVLVATATTQLSLPKLARAEQAGGSAAWRVALKSEGRRAAAAAAPLTAAACLFTLAILPRLGFDSFARNGSLFVLMAVAAFMKPLADLANTGLYSRHRDRQLAFVNLASTLLAAGLGSVLVLLVGLNGIGLSSVSLQGSLILVRGGLLRRLPEGPSD